VRSPLEVRWLIGMALRDRQGQPLGVMCIMDRRRKELTKSQRKAVLAIVRQLEGHLEQWRRPSSAWKAAKQSRPATEAGQQLLRSHEVASLFDVTERTVINWAASGKLAALRTVGGHLRFRSEDVASLLDDRLPPVEHAEVSDAQQSRHEQADGAEPLLRTHQVASLFDVTERSVINWAASGKLPSLRTLGGHLRFRNEDVTTLLEGRSRSRRSA